MLPVMSLSEHVTLGKSIYICPSFTTSATDRLAFSKRFETDREKLLMFYMGLEGC